MNNHERLSDDELDDIYHAPGIAHDCFKQLIAQAREANALREDAERYRWFREQMHPAAIDIPVSVIWGWITEGEPVSIDSPEQLDAAVDAARKGEG
jgi:hypothetical protein